MHTHTHTHTLINIHTLRHKIQFLFEYVSNKTFSITIHTIRLQTLDKIRSVNIGLFQKNLSSAFCHALRSHELPKSSDDFSACDWLEFLCTELVRSPTGQ